MFCPTCGSNQSEEKRFCTSCGTNLLVVSQALTGQPAGSNNVTPSTPNLLELERQREVAKGLRYAIIGGGLVAYKLFGFVFSGPFRGGSPFGFWTVIGFILLAIGISKIVSHRPPNAVPGQAMPIPTNQTHQDLYQSKQPASPQPVFSATPVSGYSTPNTSELESPKHPVPSVTEDDTRHLPNQSSKHKY